MLRPHQIILADNYAFLRRELRAILSNNREFRVAGEASSGLDILNLLSDGIVPDVLLLDLMMPGMSGIEALGEIRRREFDFKVLVLTLHKEQDFLCRSFQAGADGYMLKDGIVKELVPAIHSVLEDKIYLSPFMKRELPNECCVRSFAGNRAALKLKHCGKSL
jgi:DNA-binding NarL/FixJ family response regulator